METLKKLKIRNCCYIIISILFYCSCSKYYYCDVSGYGTTPSIKTYYIEPLDSSLTDDLEFNEYAMMLQERLNESGYQQDAKETAALCIRLHYYIGDKELKLSSTQSRSFSTGNVNVKSNVTYNANGQSNTTIYNNNIKTNAEAQSTKSNDIKAKQFISNTNTSETTNYYIRDAICYIEALDSKSMKPVWRVEVTDVLTESDSFRKILPWMLVSAQYFFGKSGEGTIRISEKEGTQKGLIFPYYTNMTTIKN